MNLSVAVYATSPARFALLCPSIGDIKGLDFTFFLTLEAAKETLKETPKDALILLPESQEECDSMIRTFAPYIRQILVLGEEVYDINAAIRYYPNHSLNRAALPMPSGELAYYISKEERSGIVLTTFGPFDLHVNGHAVEFHSKKAKELLALMTAYPDSTLHLDHIIALLWPNHDPFLAKRLYRDASFRLRATLKEAGAEGLVEFGHACCRINRNKASCDYWSYLNGRGDSAYYGEFMAGYSWGHTISHKLSLIRAN